MFSKTVTTAIRPLLKSAVPQALKFSIPALSVTTCPQFFDSSLYHQSKRGFFSGKSEKTDEEEQTETNKEDKTANSESDKTKTEQTQSSDEELTTAQRIADLLSRKPEGFEKEVRELFHKTQKELELKSKTVDELVQQTKAEENALESWHKKVETLRVSLKEAMEESDLTRKRYEKKMEEFKLYAITKFAKDLLEVPDNLERALESVQDPAEKENPLFEGVNATYSILVNTLSKNGITQIKSKGEKFDPNFHDALFDYQDPKATPNTCGVVAQNGYLIGERVLRPAKVGVAKK